MKSNVVKHSVFLNLNSLITTGDRYIKVSLINVILALFSDDPRPITNTIFQTSFSVQKHHSHCVSMNEKCGGKCNIGSDIDHQT